MGQLSVVRRALLGIPLRWYAALPACTARVARCLRLLLYVLLCLRLLRCLLLRCTGTGLRCSECCCCCLVATFALLHARSLPRSAAILLLRSILSLAFLAQNKITDL